MDATAVESFYNHYHAKVISHPDLYVNGDSYVDVILPGNLLEYSNAASGRGGAKTGGRVRGIRREVSNPRDALVEIFSSVESLTKFLLSSEMDANLDGTYVPRIKTKVSVQEALSAFHQNHGTDYKVQAADAKAIRKAMEDHLKTIDKPTDSDMVEAARIGFEPFKK